MDTDNDATDNRASIAALVRQHEKRLTILEVRHEEMERQTQRRFGEIAESLDNISRDFKEYKREARAGQQEVRDGLATLAVKVAAIAAGSSALINFVITLAERNR
jgi:hypothetical protein